MKKLLPAVLFLCLFWSFSLLSCNKTNDNNTTALPGKLTASLAWDKGSGYSENDGSAETNAEITIKLTAEASASQYIQSTVYGSFFDINQQSVLHLTEADKQLQEKVSQLSAGQVIAYITAGGHDYGLAKINSTSVGSAGAIEFDAKFPRVF